ncbi:MAG: putative Ig domain-containing protein [Fibrobacterota bacterium]
MHRGYPAQFTDTNYIHRMVLGGAPGNGIDALMACPPHNDYHAIDEWFFQRYLPILDDQLNNSTAQQDNQKDWSAYQYLRFDAYVIGNPVVLGMLLKDGSGPEWWLRFGVFSPLYTWRVLPGDTVTCSLPLQEVITAGELDITKMQGFFLRYAGFEGQASLSLMNIRLVGSGEDRYPIQNPREAARPFGRQVAKEWAKSIDRSLMVKNLSPMVSQVGPVTVFSGTGGYSCAASHLGGSGGTYYQNTIRGAVAYDNDRLMISMGTGSTPPAGSYILHDGPRVAYFGVLMLATFDGGQTWGGLEEGDSRPYYLNNWYQRGNLSATSEAGELYLLGTENCSSYHGAIDMFFRRLILTGHKWEEDRISMVENVQTCPGPSAAVKLPSGRIWASMMDGHDWHTNIAKYSDDDGYTWMPCKDATKTLPRPWYQSGIDPVPDSVLNFPGEFVCGAEPIPYGDSVAVISGKGYEWMIHDGTRWSAKRTVPVWGNYDEYDPLYNWPTGTVVEYDHLFFCKGGKYREDPERLTNLVTTDYHHGVWHADTLVTTSTIQDAIITASGKSVFVFYIQKDLITSHYKVMYRKWKANVWDVAVELADEAVRLNRLASPQTCPPTYACVFYDQLRTVSGQATFVKFVKVPSDPDLLIATRTLPFGVINVSYQGGVQASGGSGPYTFSRLSGALPAGLGLNADGTLSGTPTESGTFRFTVQVTDNAAGSAQGELTLRIDAVSDVTKGAPVLLVTSFFCNAPNPFSRATTFTYQLSHPQPVQISVYDIKGRLIQTVVDAKQNAGHHQVGWAARNLTPGVYIVKFVSGIKNMNRKIICLQ